MAILSLAWLVVGGGGYWLIRRYKGRRRSASAAPTDAHESQATPGTTLAFAFTDRRQLSRTFNLLGSLLPMSMLPAVVRPRRRRPPASWLVAVPTVYTLTVHGTFPRKK